MSNQRDRGRDDIGEFTGRIPKKPKNSPAKPSPSSVSNGTKNSTHSKKEESKPANNDNDAAKEKDLDPVAQARKALEMFQEVSGEAVQNYATTSSTNNNSTSVSSQGRTDEKDNGSNNSNANNRRRRIGHKGNDATKQRKDAKAETSNKVDAQEEKKKREEEEAKRQKRIEDGKARRRAFKPTIATSNDSLL
mmetsp:Transcript_4531/g.7055  ORF Transcript_4531/g.7055 Transcript_4531/m.7055 type:complete len:192 (+) Transcript_4531:135-710(+)